ncbi:MAG TPA: M1 family aminopeptidase [Thermoanaerobaculia bacterium]|nr:M1 family aminopeptidase [Thermoanaerobaculia bacterium]
MRLRPRPPVVAVALLLAGIGAAPGAAATSARVDGLRLELRLDPGTGVVEGTARLALAPADARGAGADRTVELELLAALTVEAVMRDEEAMPWNPVETDRAETGDRRGAKGGGAEEPRARPVRRFRVAVPAQEAGVARDEIEVRYRGVLREDWQAGEEAGEIHNVAVEAHVGPEGVYLSSGVPWYPRPPLDAAEGTPPVLIDFETALRGVPGMLLVASGNRVARRPPAPGMDEVWRTPFPLPAVTVAGGPHRAFVRRVGEVEVIAHLAAESAPFADGLLDAAAGYLDLYQPLIGPYPYRELAVVENFFSSGFAYPGFTLLASAVIRMGEGSLRPGYLDHELLHAWWGNGVLRAPGEGIWSEALASYCANLMRDVLEGRPDVARAQRRSILERLSQLDPARDLPVATFGTTRVTGDGASRFLGYQKGSMVFAELARRIGQDRMWYALRNLAATRMGRPTSWDDLQTSFERASGRDLADFFDYWVRGRGVPDLSPRTASWSASAGGGGELRLRLAEPAPVAVARLELRLLDDAEAEQARVEVDVEAGTEVLVVPVAARPALVELDPAFETVRRLPAATWMPTISGLAPPQPLRILRAGREPTAADARYEVVAADLRERYEQRGELVEERVRVGRRARRARDLGPGHLMVLGGAAATPAVAVLLAEAGLEVDPERARFRFEGEEHAGAEEAVLACVRRPDRPGAQVCAYWGNSAAALERSHLLTFYGGDSLLLFEAGRPVARRRFERGERLPVVEAQRP